MPSERFNTGATIPFETRFEDANAAGITNANGVIFIQRLSDQQYWNGVSFQTIRTSVAMTEVDETNSPGLWRFDFDTTVGLDVDEYLVEFKDTSLNSVNTLELLFAYIGDFLDGLSDAVARILGLQKDNFVLDPTEYSTDKVMTKGDIRVYDSVANANTDDGFTGLVFEYHIEAPRNDGKVTKYTQTRVV